MICDEVNGAGVVVLVALAVIIPARVVVFTVTASPYLIALTVARCTSDGSTFVVLKVCVIVVVDPPVTVGRVEVIAPPP
jgi:hypothetical protein